MSGNTLLRFSKRWLSDQTVLGVIAPLIADAQHECAGERGWRLLLCRKNGLIAFAVAFAISFARELTIPPPRQLQLRLHLTIQAFTWSGALMVASPLLGEARWTHAHYLIPSALAVALPLAMLPSAIVMLTNRRWQQVIIRRAVIRAMLLVIVLTGLVIGWWMPHANQSWREHIYADRRSQPSVAGIPVPGTRELTAVELYGGGISRGIRASAREISIERHRRVAITSFPVVATIMALAVAEARRHRMARAVFWWILAPTLWMLLTTPFSDTVRKVNAPLALIWLPHLVLPLLAILLYRRTAGIREASAS